MADPYASNQILAELSPTDLRRLDLEPVKLVLRQRLESPNKPIQHVYFVDSGIVSVVATGPARQSIEVGVIGLEGCTGLPHILAAARSPLDTYVQVSGTARRIASDKLANKMDESKDLQIRLLRAAHAFAMQVAFTALANGHAALNQRLARWLLMAQDRLQSTDIGLTHEFLAIMLGVRRPGVTVALADLQVAGLVSLRRGVVVIQDRDGLLRLADRYYGPPEAELDRIRRL